MEENKKDNKFNIKNKKKVTIISLLAVLTIICIGTFIYKYKTDILKHKEIANKIFFICNNTEIYAILIVNDNNYYWSICHNNTSYPLEEKTEKNNDYIVEMIINFINEKKFQNIIPNLQEMNTETKIKALKNIKLNSKGYHIK